MNVFFNLNDILCQVLFYVKNLKMENNLKTYLNHREIIGGIKFPIDSIRPLHAIKNMLVFIPILIIDNANDTNLIIDLLYAFFVVSLFQSFIYIKNDISDIDRDRSHPIKSKRAIASGRLSVRKASIISKLLLILSIFFSLFDFHILQYMIIYYFSYLFYTEAGKKIPIIDAIMLSFFHVLRILLGFIIAGESISIVMLIFVSGFFYLMATKKRTKEKDISSDFRFKNKSHFYEKKNINMTYFFCSAVLFLSSIFLNDMTMETLIGVTSYYFLNDSKFKSDELAIEVINNLSVPLFFILTIISMVN